jgi:hypothetical protein
MSRYLELPLAHLRKHLQRPEVLNALVLRIFLSCGLDFLFSLLADQSRQYQNHPAARAGCLAHPARLHFADRDHPPLDNSHPAALALPPTLADWFWPFWLGAVVTIAGLLFAIWAREHLGSNWSRSVTIKQGHELITSGPYAVVRHPIYTGILTGFLSMAIAISQVRGSSFSFSSSSRSGSRSAWRNSGCVLSSARHMPPMLIRPLPWCLTSSDRCVTISANNSELNQFEELHREIDSRFRSSNGQSLLYR